jgi:chromate reductase, NAD(P)H dehydrogenase (quinone)
MSQMNRPIHILGIAGSLQRGSYNRAALRAATGLAPKGAIIETFELDGIPSFNRDEEQNPPAKVTELKRRIREANAILFVTPEYNWSVSGRAQNHLRQILVYLNMFPIRQVCHYSQTTAGG